MPEETYLIRRFYFDEEHSDHRKVMRRGLTLEEAQAHCRDPRTRARTNSIVRTVRWFDGYEREA